MEMDLGSGVALGGLCVSAGAVCITAIRAKSSREDHGIHPLCSEHSGVAACLEAIEKGQERHEEWLSEISKDIKALLRK